MDTGTSVFLTMKRLKKMLFLHLVELKVAKFVLKMKKVSILASFYPYNLLQISSNFIAL